MKHDTNPAPAPERVPEDAEQLVEQVRQRYGRIAAGQTPGVAGKAGGCCDTAGGCCGTADETVVAQRIGYADGDLDVLPEGSNLGLGCGAPIAQLGLQSGEVVLDLGSGGGLDVFLAARDVGPEGRVIGVDMTPEMILRATEAAERAGLGQAEFRQGRLEALPVEDSSIDAVTSNCVINLVPDKGAVFREIARVLRPGGRVVISDILLDAPLPAALERDLLAYVGCIAGAMSRESYLATIESAGLREVEFLKDADYLAVLRGAMPEEATELLQRSGAQVEDLRGVVRSVTLRAKK